MDDWRFDLWSALVGLAAGILSSVLYRRLRGPVEQRWDRLRKRAQSWSHWLSAGVEGRYLREVAEYAQHRHLGAGAALLKDIFVPTRLIAPLPEPQPDTGDILPTPQLPHLWPELAAQVAIQPPPTLTLGQMAASTRRVVLLAPAGGGKSTTLAYLALACARPDDYEELNFRPNSLPIYAHLAELDLPDSPEADKQRPAEEYLIKAAQNRAGTLTADTLPAVLRQALQDGRALVLLDGWDELAAAERPAYTQWLSDLLSLFPDNQFVLSAPLDGYGPLLELEFVPLSLKSWQAAEVTQLARRWATTLGATLPTVRESQRPGADQIPALDFWQAGMTPLDTTLNLWLMLAGESPPLHRASRYGASIHHTLAPFGDEGANWPLEIGHQALGSLAHEMDEAESRITTPARLEEIINLILSQREEASGKAAQECLKVLGQLSGLLIAWGEDRLVFQSPTMYAYFWAYQTASRQDITTAQSKSRDPEWASSLSFFAEMTDAGPLIKDLLATPADLLQEDLFLAANWSANAQGKEQWMRNILIRLAQILVDSNAPLALRERAAATLVSVQDSGVSYLLRQAISSPDAALRAIAAPGLGALATELPGRPGDKKSLQLLIQELQDPSDKVKTAIIHALAPTRSEAAVEALIRALLEAEPAIRQVAAEAIARMGEEGHQILREALTEDDVLVRRTAIHGLALVDEAWVTETLETIRREDEEWLVRSAAEELLNERLKGEPTEPMEPVRAENLGWLVSWAAERGAGVPAGPGATAMLQRVLKEADHYATRAVAARSLGAIGQKTFTKPLSAALQDPSRNTQEAAYFALATISRAWNQRLITPAAGGQK